jgi:GntR family transcriptional regulator
MTFTLNPHDLDKRSAVPYWRQLADLLGAAINLGELQPGDSLPSEPEAEAALGVSRPVIRQAYDDLERRGKIIRRRGTTPKVAEPTHERHMDAARYEEELAILDELRDGTLAEHPHTSHFSQEYDVPLADVTVSADYLQTSATEADAAALGIRAGAPTMERNLLKWVNGEPVQLQRSVVPRGIAIGTVLADPKAQPMPGGTIAELYQAGYRVTEVRHKARVRQPDDTERRDLQLDSYDLVLDVERIFYDGDHAVEVSRVVRPAVGTVLVFNTVLR